MPKVSVIVPCHNVEKYIGLCLNSLLNQQLKDIEIICINDHSQDSTFNLLTKAEKENPDKVKVINLFEETGCSSARNAGLKIATGDYIGFVDGDDMVSLNMFLDFYYLAKHYDVPIISGQITQVDADFQELKTNLNSEKKLFYLSKNKVLLLFEPPSCCHRLFKHEILTDESFLVNKKYEDVAFTIPLLIKADKQLKVIEDSYFYRVNSSGIMANTMLPNINILDIIDDLQEVKRKLKQLKLLNDYREVIDQITKKYVLATGFYILNWPISEEEKRQMLKLYLSICAQYSPDLLQDDSFYIKEIIKKLKDYLPDSLFISEEEYLRKKFQKEISLIKIDKR